MATCTLARSGWTGTVGVFDAAVEEDWEEAFRQAQERSIFCKNPIIKITPVLVAQAWKMLLEIFGDEAQTCDFTVQELVSFYLSS